MTYAGKESTAPAVQSTMHYGRILRQRLENFHGKVHEDAIPTAWPHLGRGDRFIRWAALTAIQHQPLAQWKDKALNEPDPSKRTLLLLGLCKVAADDPANGEPRPVDKELAQAVYKSLLEVDWERLDHTDKLTLLRAYQVALVRLGKPGPRRVEQIIAQLDPRFPAPDFEQNWLLCETLAYLQAPGTAAKGMALLESAATQEEQIEYARSLRMLKAGWTTELRTAYFNWFLKAANYRGGASFSKFIEFIRRDAVASLDAASRDALKDLLAQKPVSKTPYEVMAEAMIGRKFVKPWTVDELAAAAGSKLKGQRDFERGRKMFAAGGCFACHRFANEGGMTGPDLTGSAGRYSPRDLLEQIINPSSEINEQFVPVIVNLKDGQSLTGVVVNMNGDRVTVNTDMFNPNQRVSVQRPKVASIEPSKVSPMPPGLLNLMQEDEVMDLLAYILSGGDSAHAWFKDSP